MAASKIDAPLSRFATLAATCALALLVNRCAVDAASPGLPASPEREEPASFVAQAKRAAPPAGSPGSAALRAGSGPASTRLEMGEPQWLRVRVEPGQSRLRVPVSIESGTAGPKSAPIRLAALMGKGSRDFAWDGDGLVFEGLAPGDYRLPASLWLHARGEEEKRLRYFQRAELPCDGAYGPEGRCALAFGRPVPSIESPDGSWRPADDGPLLASARALSRSLPWGSPFLLLLAPIALRAGGRRLLSRVGLGGATLALSDPRARLEASLAPVPPPARSAPKP